MPFAFDSSLLHLLHRANQVANSVFSEELEGDGLTARQFIVLSALAVDLGLSQTHVASRTGIDRSTMTDIVRRLSRRGLVVRKRSKQDARVLVLTITTSGMNALDESVDRARRADIRLQLALDPDAGPIFFDALRRLIKSADGQHME
jgi:DNA-binding MarR family transcriptional regulator